MSATCYSDEYDDVMISVMICEDSHQIQQTPGSLSSIYHRIQSGPEGPIQNKH